MKIIMCHSFVSKEINPLLQYFSRVDIRKYIKKVAKGLGVEIKGSMIPSTKLIKVYMTGKRGAGRMIVLVYVKKNYYIPVLLRLKKDKIIGNNFSKGNKMFQNLLKKNLDLIVEDLKKGDFDYL